MKKSTIFYARPFRHLKANYKMMTVYFLLFLLPCVAIYLFSYSKLTREICHWTIHIFSIFEGNSQIGIGKGNFLPYFGEVYYVLLPSKMPNYPFILMNLMITLVLIVLCAVIKDKAKPLSIYANIGLLIHLVSCIYFLLFKEHFPYSLSQYSELYIKQQVGIWLSFIFIAGLVSGMISNSGISKYIMLFTIIGYSFLFGCIRYVVFLGFLLKASSLYMATLFFTFGPFFDFLYLVCIYSIYMNHLTLKLDDRERGEEWQWA